MQVLLRVHIPRSLSTQVSALGNLCKEEIIVCQQMTMARRLLISLCYYRVIGKSAKSGENKEVSERKKNKVIKIPPASKLSMIISAMQDTVL